MRLHKTLLLKIAEPNEGKREKLARVIDLYAKVLRFYLEVIPHLGMYRIAAMSSKEALTFLEFNTVPTKAHPNPPYPVFSGVQVGIRRSAINKAVGMVKSYLSNLLRWHKEGKELGYEKPSYPRPVDFALTYYATDVDFEDVLKAKEFAFVRLKVVNENGNYEFVNYPVKPYKWFHERLQKLTANGWKLKKTATLIKRDKDFYVALVLEKKITRKTNKKPKYVVNVDLNICRNLACIGIFEVNWEKRLSRLEKVYFINGELSRLVWKRDYLLEQIFIKQRLTGRKPVKGDNKRLWQKISRLNRDIALKVAREIAKLVEEYDNSVVVFENLKGLRGKKGKKSRKLNRRLSHWLRRRIVERVKEIALEEGFGVDFVYPSWTSKRCSVCGALGERFSPNGSTALFGCPVCRYTVNADVNAVFNQHFLYLSHFLHGGGKRDPAVSLGASLKGPEAGRNLRGVPKATATFGYE